MDVIMFPRLHTDIEKRWPHFERIQLFNTNNQDKIIFVKAKYNSEINMKRKQNIKSDTCSGFHLDRCIYLLFGQRQKV